MTIRRLAACIALVLAAAAWPASAADTALGVRVSAVGDVNGDGVPDFAARRHNEVVVFSGSNASELWSAQGFDATGIPDQNGDGKPDVAVASDEAVAVLCVGATGVAIRDVPKTPGDFGRIGDAYTQSITCVGDVDGDGKADLLVVRRGPRSGLGKFAAHVMSLNGKLIRDLESFSDGDGWTAIAAYDFDKDGTTDFAVRRIADQSHLGVAYVSATKGLLAEVKGTLGDRPEILAFLGDADGDGKPEYLFGSTLASNGEKRYAGQVRVVSGKDAKTTLRAVKGEKESEALGTSLAALGDVDGDAFPDFAAGAPGAIAPKDKNKSTVGAVRAFSGKSGKVLWTSYGQGLLSNFGSSLAAIGDVNGDGVADVVAGSSSKGFVRVISGKTGDPLGEAGSRR